MYIFNNINAFLTPKCEFPAISRNIFIIQTALNSLIDDQNDSLSRLDPVLLKAFMQIYVKYNHRIISEIITYKINLFRINLRALMYGKFLPVHYLAELILKTLLWYFHVRPKLYISELKFKALLRAVILFVMGSENSNNFYIALEEL